MGKMDSDVDTTDAVWILGHRPFRIDYQALSGNAVPSAELPDEIPDTTGDGPDKQFNRSHSGILSPVLQRLVGDDSMLAAHDVVARSAVKGRREFHVISPGLGSFAAAHRHSTPRSAAWPVDALDTACESTDAVTRHSLILIGNIATF